MNFKPLLTVGLLFISSSAWAQQCPPGIAHGTPGCIPPDNPASPLYQPNEPVAPPMIWADRWGAIAIAPHSAAGNSGVVGASVGLSSRGEARKVAMAECRAKRGEGCKIELAYFNQCAVIVWGDNGYLTQGAATVGEASRLGIKECSKHDVNCQIYYSNCSMAERVQ